VPPLAGVPPTDAPPEFAPPTTVPPLDVATVEPPPLVLPPLAVDPPAPVGEPPEFAALVTGVLFPHAVAQMETTIAVNGLRA
jgi:hypothetical protein